jgi:hypothetical protein
MVPRAWAYRPVPPTIVKVSAPSRMTPCSRIVARQRRRRERLTSAGEHRDSLVAAEATARLTPN